jgi:hypothetical protein
LGRLLVVGFAVLIMAEHLMIYQPGDRLATMGSRGEARVWQVRSDGVLFVAAGRSEREATREAGRRLASEREDLIAQGIDPADLTVPLDPGDGEDEGDGR